MCMTGHPVVFTSLNPGFVLFPSVNFHYHCQDLRSLVISYPLPTPVAPRLTSLFRHTGIMIVLQEFPKLHLFMSSAELDFVLLLSNLLLNTPFTVNVLVDVIHVACKSVQVFEDKALLNVCYCYFVIF